jgi:hypothetical protein
MDGFTFKNADRSIDRFRVIKQMKCFWLGNKDKAKAKAGDNVVACNQSTPRMLQKLAS